MTERESKSVNKPETVKRVKTEKSSKVTCLGCGKKYEESAAHRHGSYCGYHSEECFNKNGK